MDDSDSESETATVLPRDSDANPGDSGDITHPTGKMHPAEGDPEELAVRLREGREKWSNLSFEELLVGYRAVIWPRLAAEGYDPETTVPTRQWLVDQGHRNLEYALREYHDTTLRRFCTEHVGVDPDAADDRAEWPTENDATRERLNAWLAEKRDRSESIESENTVRTLYSRLKTYVEIYVDEWGDDLLAAVQDENQRRDANDMVETVYDQLQDRLETTQTRHKYHRTISSWYDYLVNTGRAAFNPVDGLANRYGWTSADSKETTAPSDEQMRELAHATETLEERLLLVALGAWGLRRGEVAALHRRQFTLDPADAPGPYIEFEQRKNGPGTVALLYGDDVVRERLAAVTEEWTDHTSGYLFPSTRSESGHISGTTVYNRFQTVAKRAGVEIDGSTITPKYCRRYWYNAYTAVMNDADEWLDEVAAAQGSASVDVLKQNYLEADTLREIRRDSMREQLATVFSTY